MTTKKSSKYFVIRDFEIKDVRNIMLGKQPSVKGRFILNAYKSLEQAKEALRPERIERGFGIYDARLDNWAVRPEVETNV